MPWSIKIIFRPYNKKNYIALKPIVDATLADLLASNYYSKLQNHQFFVAAVKFNLYWASRRITRQPITEERIEKRFRELFGSGKLTTLKGNSKGQKLPGIRELNRAAIGIEDPKHPGGVMDAGNV